MLQLQIFIHQPSTSVNITKAFHGLRGSAGLKMPIHAHFFRRAISTDEVGQTDLVFGVQ